MHLQLIVHVFDVRLNGASADEQAGCDLAKRETLAKKDCYLHLSMRKAAATLDVPSMIEVSAEPN